MVLSSQPPRSAEFCRPQATVWNLWMPVSESEYKFFGIFLSECRPSLIDFSSGKGWKPKEDVDALDKLNGSFSTFVLPREKNGN